MARRRFNVFSLSFLDVMSCGLGAVVLFYMIINAQVAKRADEENIRLLAETRMLEEQVLDGRKDLVRVRNTLESKTERRVRAEGEAERLQRQLEEILEELATRENTTVASVESIEELKADIKRLEEAKKRLSARAADQGPAPGQRIRSYVGDGNRQYLTGMKMGGRRVLILVDASASMLGYTYVETLRNRAMPASRRRLAPKWQQAVNTVDWLTTQVRPGTKFQVYTFNEEAGSVLGEGGWLTVTDGSELARAVTALRSMTPENGSSLYKAFAAVANMDPRPDNIYLLTDGLPTQGRSAPSTPEKISASRRAKYFRDAVGQLPRSIPVNVLLYPMDGDPEAAGAFWTLADNTRGSFMTPARDWP